MKSAVLQLKRTRAILKTDTNEKEPDTAVEEKELKEIEDEEGEQKNDCQSDGIYDSIVKNANLVLQMRTK